jgi:hypothetical protein
MTSKQKQHCLSAAIFFLKCAEADENFFQNTVLMIKCGYTAMTLKLNTAFKMDKAL